MSIDARVLALAVVAFAVFGFRGVRLRDLGCYRSVVKGFARERCGPGGFGRPGWLRGELRLLASGGGRVAGRGSVKGER